MATVLGILKIFEKQEYVEDFRNGRLHMNTISAFREHPDLDGIMRGDAFEGVAGIYQPNMIGEISFGNVKIPASELAAPILIHKNDLLNSNVFCMYSISDRDVDVKSISSLDQFAECLRIHHDCFGLGEFCVGIINAEEFKRRCLAAARKLRTRIAFGPVEYFDENTFHGNFEVDKLGFHKRNRFRVQKEYRLLLSQHTPEPGRFFLDIGDIHDITFVTTPREFNEKMKLIPKEHNDSELAYDHHLPDFESISSD